MDAARDQSRELGHTDVSYFRLGDGNRLAQFAKKGDMLCDRFHCQLLDLLTGFRDDSETRQIRSVCPPRLAFPFDDD